MVFFTAKGALHCIFPFILEKGAKLLFIDVIKLETRFGLYPPLKGTIGKKCAAELAYPVRCK